MTEAETLRLLYFSERELWFDCHRARPTLARLARYRKAERRVIVSAADGPASITVCGLEGGRSTATLACDLGVGRDGVLVNLGATGLFRLAQACMKRYAELVLDG